MERYFQKLKCYRRIATRYDKLACVYRAFIYIASILIKIGNQARGSTLKNVRYRCAKVFLSRLFQHALVKDGYNGYVFKMDDEDSLKLIIDKLEKDTLIQLGNNAFGEFKKNFSETVMREKMKAIYEEILSGK